MKKCLVVTDVIDDGTFGVMLCKLRSGKDDEYKVGKLTERQVISTIVDNGIHCVNARVEGGKLIGNGSFDRLKNDGIVLVSKLVIRDELGDRDGEIIGYCVVHNKKPMRLSKEDILKKCREARERGVDSIIHNAAYVKEVGDKQEHLREIVQGTILTEVVRLVKKRNTVVNNNNINAENKESKLILGEEFSEEQKRILYAEYNNGINISDVCNPKLSINQMKMLLNGIKSGIDVKELAKPEFDKECLAVYLCEMSDGLDMTAIIDSRYTLGQLVVLVSALWDGTDIRSFADPNISISEMRERKTREESGIYKLNAVCEGTISIEDL